jgi:Ca-activated chloride channel family protein
MGQRVNGRGSRVWVVLLAVTVVLLLAGCATCYWVYRLAQQDIRGENRVELQVAYSPEKQQLLEELVKRFHATRPRTASGRQISISLSRSEPETMIGSSLAGQFDAICPDSSVWLAQLEAGWQERFGSDRSVVGETTRFAVSPVVIAMWEDTARAMGYPDETIGWADLLSTARSNPDFKWSHPSTSSASGLLATLATFYAGAGKTRGLTVDDATTEATLEYVAALEKTVRYYGEGELAVIEQVRAQGPAYLDAFVVQEQLLIQFNQQSANRLVAVYPMEGTMWKDHPLVLLERLETTSEQREAFRSFSQFLVTTDAQMLVLEQGYRPTDLSISLDSPSSPIRPDNGVDPSQPETTLQIPSAAVIEVVRDVWQYTKRKTNVYLVADTSGSMQGEKLEQAQEAFLTFLGSIKAGNERVGLITFSSRVFEEVSLAELATNRAVLQSAISDLSAGGDTALLDAVYLAHHKLEGLRDSERINAIVVMTDGKENNSRIRLGELTAELGRASQSGLPVVVFCVAYGGDADMGTLEEISAATGGQTRRGSPETIQRLYKLLSTYF